MELPVRGAVYEDPDSAVLTPAVVSGFPESLNSGKNHRRNKIPETRKISICKTKNQKLKPKLSDSYTLWAAGVSSLRLNSFLQSRWNAPITRWVSREGTKGGRCGRGSLVGQSGNKCRELVTFKMPVPKCCGSKERPLRLAQNLVNRSIEVKGKGQPAGPGRRAAAASKVSCH